MSKKLILSLALSGLVITATAQTTIAPAMPRDEKIEPVSYTHLQIMNGMSVTERPDFSNDTIFGITLENRETIWTNKGISMPTHWHHPRQRPRTSLWRCCPARWTKGCCHSRCFSTDKYRSAPRTQHPDVYKRQVLPFYQLFTRRS